MTRADRVFRGGHHRAAGDVAVFPPERSRGYRDWFQRSSELQPGSGSLAPRSRPKGSGAAGAAGIGLVWVNWSGTGPALVRNGWSRSGF